MMLNETQLKRLFALASSLEKLSEDRREEGREKAKEFLYDCKIHYYKNLDEFDIVCNLSKTYKMEIIRELVETKRDDYNLYKDSYIKDEDIIEFLGLNELKKVKNGNENKNI